jgi:MinD superfamily P-loop ATPase
VGKSTITLNLATCLHLAGHRAIVIDTDPQGTCRMWAAKAAEVEHVGPPVVAMDGKTLRRDLERVSSGFDVAIIDCPPRMGAETRSAMLASDLVVLPVTPGAADVWYGLHGPRSRRRTHRDRSSRSWKPGQRAAACSFEGVGGGTVMSPISTSS